MRKNDIVEKVQELFEASCRELFEYLNCDISPLDDASEELEDAPHSLY
ncbi:MAG: hypothetical protein HN790_02270 [Methylococcales bacterium]|jgi:hypothetical protein|nr:hypothetical protein [Methylococcales bacterium]